METNHKPKTSRGICVALELCANTLAFMQQTFLCDEWKIGAPHILSESHLCMVFKTAASLGSAFEIQLRLLMGVHCQSHGKRGKM